MGKGSGQGIERLALALVKPMNYDEKTLSAQKVHRLFKRHEELNKKMKLIADTIQSDSFKVSPIDTRKRFVETALKVREEYVWVVENMKEERERHLEEYGEDYSISLPL